MLYVAVGISCKHACDFSAVNCKFTCDKIGKILKEKVYQRFLTIAIYIYIFFAEFLLWNRRSWRGKV